MKQSILSQKRLKELLVYDPETGVFTWITGLHKVAGTKHHSGYVLIKIDYVLHSAHRLAFLYMTGTWPHDTVDHINRVKNDNRWANLRDVTKSLNNINRKQYELDGFKNNKLGELGIHHNKKGFCVKLNFKYYGTYATIEQAREKRNTIRATAS